MRGCLFTLLLGAIVIAFVVVVGLPAVAGAMLTAGLTAAGLQADDTRVTVSSSPPTDLLGLRADVVRVTATDATFRGLRIGALDLTLGDVRILDRTAGTVDGDLREVRTDVAGGDPILLDRISVQGTDEVVTAITTIPNEEAEGLIADGIERQTGIRPREVRLERPDRLVIDIGVAVAGRLLVTGEGHLVVRAEGPLDGTTVVLVRGGEDLPIRLTSVRVNDDGGLRLMGDLALALLG